MNPVDLCPRCHLIIPQERMMDSLVVCSHCGWVLSGQERRIDKKLGRQFRNQAFLLSVALVAVFIHLVTWDHFFLEVIPLKARQILNISSAAEMTRLAQICEERMNPTCSESALKEAARRQPEDLELLAQLGKLQYKLNAFDRAAYSLQGYFSRGGRAVEPAYHYARSLEETGRNEEAAQYYDFVLASKDESLQITVTQKYLNFLRKTGQFARAVEVIQSIQAKGSNASTFLDAELQELKKKINGDSVRADS